MLKKIELWFVKSFLNIWLQVNLKQKRYIGGAYGLTNEYDMMVDIEKYGPIVVNLKSD